MPIRSYGYLHGRVIDIRRESDEASPHFEIHVQPAPGVVGELDFRVAVNVKSQAWPSELLYVAIEDFQHPVLQELSASPEGWTEVPRRPGGVALDYIRGNLFDRQQMRALPADLPGGDNDLSDILESWAQRAKGDEQARIFAFGERWGPQPERADQVFGFTPGNGVHDIHMNQGNSPDFAAGDGVWQDGGLLLHFPGAQRWVALFLAFLSQSWHTEDANGHSLTGGPAAASEEAVMRIVGALVKPGGPDSESVTLLNASPGSVDLTGWALVDRQKQRMALPELQIAAGATVLIRLRPPVQLGNGGGALTLLDPQGLKVHGVAYTAAQARRRGWTVVF